jgi:hypothetical protein
MTPSRMMRVQTLWTDSVSVPSLSEEGGSDDTLWKRSSQFGFPWTYFQFLVCGQWKGSLSAVSSKVPVSSASEKLSEFRAQPRQDSRLGDPNRPRPHR